MKKIISTALIFAISVFASSLFAQQITSEQRIAFQTDNVETFKKAFPKEDYNKCLGEKDITYNLLAYSVRFDRKNIFNYLLTNNVDINKICSNLSPLMSAAEFGRPDLAKTLLKKGASKNLKNENGETAKDISVKYKQAALTEILK